MSDYTDYFRKDGTQDRELIELIDKAYQQGRADSCGTIGVTEDGEYIMYDGHLYKKVADRVKGAEE